MEVKPGYKQTEVGVIPEEWEVSTATEACALVVDCKNRTPPVVADSDYAVVRTPNVRDGHFVLEELRFTDESSYHEWTARAVPQFGDIMITREAPLGEVCAVPAGRKVCLGQRMMLYRPSPTRTDSTYLLFSLMSLPVRANLQRKIGGSTVGHAKVEDIRNLQLPLPPLPEQRAIAEALGDVDALLGALDRLIAKKRDLKQATMQQILTGQTRLPGFEGEWEVKTLGQVCSFENGDRSNNYPSPGSFRQSGIPFINAGHVAAGYISTNEMNYITQEAYDRLGGGKVKAGDILFCLRGSLGKFGLVSSNFGHGAIASSLVIIRPKEAAVSCEYLCCYFSSALCAQMIETWSGGAAQPNLGAKELARFSIQQPPFPEQTAIAEVLSDMDAELAELEGRRDKTRMIKQGMMQELLTGRTRLL